MTDGGEKLPVVIVGGPQRDARREVAQALLRRVRHSVALHHDLSAAGRGTAHRTVRDASGELSGGEVGERPGDGPAAVRGLDERPRTPRVTPP